MDKKKDCTVLEVEGKELVFQGKFTLSTENILSSENGINISFSPPNLFFITQTERRKEKPIYLSGSFKQRLDHNSSVEVIHQEKVYESPRSNSQRNFKYEKFEECTETETETDHETHSSVVENEKPVVKPKKSLRTRLSSLKKKISIF
jgi:hypothetical protein